MSRSNATELFYKAIRSSREDYFSNPNAIFKLIPYGQEQANGQGHANGQVQANKQDMMLEATKLLQDRLDYVIQLKKNSRQKSSRQISTEEEIEYESEEMKPKSEETEHELFSNKHFKKYI